MTSTKTLCLFLAPDGGLNGSQGRTCLDGSGPDNKIQKSRHIFVASYTSTLLYATPLCKIHASSGLSRKPVKISTNGPSLKFKKRSPDLRKSGEHPAIVDSPPKLTATKGQTKQAIPAQTDTSNSELVSICFDDDSKL